MTQSEAVDVVVIGAGMAGLAAARSLAEAGLRVVVLEARNRVGGRIFTERTAEGALVEHGAEFVHGRDPALWSLIEEAHLATVERDGSMLQEGDDHTGIAVTSHEEEESLYSGLAALADLPEDLSFAAWLEASGLPAFQKEALTGFVEGFNAADADRISCRSLGLQQRADDALEADRAWHITGGYARLPEFLAEQARAAGAEVRLGAEVTAVRWCPGRVVVSVRQQPDVRAARCVVALPLGVLHAANAAAPGSVRIEPEPRALFEARRLVMGNVARFTMVFRERWWERAAAPDPKALRRMSFLFTTTRTPPVWWTRHPEEELFPTLVGWSGGPRCVGLLGSTPEQLGLRACQELAEAFHLPVAELQSGLVAVHTYDWSVDRYACGSYSYVAAGAVEASAAMCEPAADTLFFAGEHTDTGGHWGTVHAALHSGQRAAKQILR